MHLLRPGGQCFLGVPIGPIDLSALQWRLRQLRLAPDGAIRQHVAVVVDNLIPAGEVPASLEAGMLLPPAAVVAPVPVEAAMLLPAVATGCDQPDVAELPLPVYEVPDSVVAALLVPAAAIGFDHVVVAELLLIVVDKVVLQIVLEESDVLLAVDH